jgi:hypothetical protein
MAITLAVVDPDAVVPTVDAELLLALPPQPAISMAPASKIEKK